MQRLESRRQLLDYFFDPKSIAVFGLSASPRGLGQQVLRSLVEGGYQGEIYPIHPQLRRSMGLPCYQSLDEVPTNVDVAVFATSPQAIIPELESCSRRRVKGIIIISGGFKEKTPEGGYLQDQIVEEAKSRGMRIIGPNCPGVYDPKTKAQTLFQSYERLLRPGPGRIALLTQSTAIGCLLLDWMAEEGLGISRFIGYGNRADLDETDFLEYLGRDLQTKLIGLHVESFANGRRFLETAAEVLTRKPIIILKTGRGPKSAGKVATHTGGLAGSYRLQSAIFRQTGLIETNTIEDFMDALKIYSFYERTRGDNLAIITNGAGFSIVAADLAVRHGLRLAEFRTSTIEALKQALPPHCMIGNPVDLMGSASSDDYKRGMDVLLKEEQIHALLVCIVLQNTFLEDEIIQVIADMLRYRKPILVCAAGGPFSRKRIAAIQMKGVPVFPTPERAAKAAAYLASRSQHMLRSLEEY